VADRIVLSAAELADLLSGASVHGFDAGTLSLALAELGKGAPSLQNAKPVSADVVYRHLEGNFPDSAIGWVRRASSWVLAEVPWDLINDDDIGSWAASHQPAAVREDADEIADEPGSHPGVLIRRPGASRLDLVDGHHHALARRKLRRPVLGYVGDVRAQDVQSALETHSAQRHSGSDPRNKSAKPPVAAGLAVRAADTGRVLMLQRAVSEDEDPAGGFWEFPGGRLDGDEDPLEAARREWAEEVGLEVPDGDLTGLWNASNGKYRGFVLTVPSEDGVDIFGDRDDVANPDGDPDGDITEALAWWDPGQLKDNPALRPELAEDHKRVRRALKSAETPYLSTHHAPIGHEGVWHSKHPPMQLPPYIQNIRNALMREGMPEREAHAQAVAAIERWRLGDLKWGPHRHVTPAVQAASQEAYEQWMALRREHP